MQRVTGLDRSETRSLLAKFGLGADHVGRTGAELSPGERSRAQVAVLMASGVNCLVLDEPTNHLDIEAIEQLESALGAYEGTLLVVSHDRRFLESLHLTRTVDVAALAEPQRLLEGVPVSMASTGWKRTTRERGMPAPCLGGGPPTEASKASGR
ncbi:MAG: ATP-binding cassette domain-containing protein [Acidimicrobiales bacterium]